MVYKRLHWRQLQSTTDPPESTSTIEQEEASSDPASASQTGDDLVSSSASMSIEVSESVSFLEPSSFSLSWSASDPGPSQSTPPPPEPSVSDSSLLLSSEPTRSQSLSQSQEPSFSPSQSEPSVSASVSQSVSLSASMSQSTSLSQSQSLSDPIPSQSDSFPSISESGFSQSEPTPSSQSIPSQSPPSLSDPVPSFSEPGPSVSIPEPSFSPPPPSVSQPEPSISEPGPSQSEPTDDPPSSFIPLPSVSDPPSSLSPAPSSSIPEPSSTSSDPTPSTPIQETTTRRPPGSPPPITSFHGSSTTNTGTLGTETSRPNAFANNTGAIIGVALGVLGFIIAVGLAAFFIVRRYRRQHHPLRTTSTVSRPVSRNNHLMPRSMTLVEDDDMHDSASASTSMMRGLPGIITALDIGDNPRPGPSVRGYSTPYNSDENAQVGPSSVPMGATTTRRGSMSAQSAMSVSVYSDPPPTPMFGNQVNHHGPSAYTYATGSTEQVDHASSAGHASSSGSHQRARSTPAPPPLGGSFRPKSPSATSHSDHSTHRQSTSLFARLRGGKSSPASASSEEQLPPGVPGIVLSQASTPSGTLRGRPVPGTIPMEDVPMFQYPDLSSRHPPWTPYVLPPDSIGMDATPDSESMGAPAGLLRTDVERRTNDSRTSLGDHVDYTRPTLGIVFNRMPSTGTFETRTDETGRTRGDDGHSVY